MIPAIHPRGTKVAGLLRYLFGPGRREEHTNPRLVAAWTDAWDLADLEPPVTASGGREIRRLAEQLNQPVKIGHGAPGKTVWHCSIRTHPSDRTLSDAQWGHIAAEVMAGVGLAPYGDHRAVRWVAVRHGPDHIHLVATLVRQDRRTAWAWHDRPRAQAACRDLEVRYGLYRVGPPGQGTRRWPHPAELNKTTRQHRAVPAREQLRQHVRTAAATAVDEADFYARLRTAGVLLRLRHSSREPEQVTGYAVGLAGHTTGAGDPVWYGGGRLAPDLTLPQLRTRWAGPPSGPEPPLSAARLAASDTAPTPAQVYQRAAQAVRQAAADLTAATSPGQASAIAYAAADVLTAAATACEGRRGGPLTDAAEMFDRAAHDRHGRTPTRRVPTAVQLRSMARLIALMRRLSRDEDTMAVLQLVHTLAAFAEHLADIRNTQDRMHQARAARTAAGQLRGYTSPPRGGPARPPQPGAGRSTAWRPAAGAPHPPDRHGRHR